MRLLVRLSARVDAAYDNTYHRKLAGRLWGSLEGTPYDEEHDSERPKPFAFSNPFPPGDMRAGDSRTLLVSSPDEQLLTHVARDLTENPELDIGSMRFIVDDVSALETDVGEPGTTGTIETGTGVLVRIPPWRFDDYGIDTDHDEAEFWRPEHTLNPFRTQIKANLDKKHEQFCPEYLPGPSEVDGDLFIGYDLIKTFALPVTVKPGYRETWVLSKWAFEYRVRDDHHRRHLNLALDVGIGERNALGFGFVNVTDRTRPGESELEGADAFA